MLDVLTTVFDGCRMTRRRLILMGTGTVRAPSHSLIRALLCLPSNASDSDQSSCRPTCDISAAMGHLRTLHPAARLPRASDDNLWQPCASRCLCGACCRMLRYYSLCHWPSPSGLLMVCCGADEIETQTDGTEFAAYSARYPTPHKRSGSSDNLWYRCDGALAGHALQVPQVAAAVPKPGNHAALRAVHHDRDGLWGLGLTFTGILVMIIKQCLHMITCKKSTDRTVCGCAQLRRGRRARDRPHAVQGLQQGQPPVQLAEEGPSAQLRPPRDAVAGGRLPRALVQHCSCALPGEHPPSNSRRLVTLCGMEPTLALLPEAFSVTEVKAGTPACHNGLPSQEQETSTL